MASRKVVLSDLPVAEKERFYEFLVANKVEFIADATGENFVATIRVVPPEPSTARITGRARQATKATMRRGNSQPRAKARALSATATGTTVDAATTLKAAQSVLRRRYTRFCTLLPALTQPPKAVRRTALSRFAEDVYNARYEKDAAYIKSEASGENASKLPQTFPDFVFEFAAKRYGLKQLVSEKCWGMVSSVELQRGQHIGIDLFGKFLEESYDATDLLFFLFTRNAIERVVSQSKAAGEEDSKKKSNAGEEEDEGPKKNTNSKSTVLPAEIRMDAKQMVQVVRLAIDSKRQELRDVVIKKLDAAMAARTETSTRKAPTLEPERLLSIATEEYHNSREFKTETGLENSAEGALALAAGTKLGEMPAENQLTPEVRKEVRQVTQRLIQSLSQQGETDVNPQQVYEWALQVTLRRHKLGDFLDQEVNKGSSAMDLTEMQQAAMDLVESSGDGPGLAQAFVPSDAVLQLSPEEFERNLEGNVRQLLLNATSDLVGQAVEALPGKTWKDEKAAATLRSALIAEFAPAADIIMEAIVSKDYRRWLETLKIEGSGTSRHRQQFEKLHDEFQQVLNSDITPSVVQTICRSVVSVDELHEMVKARAASLATVGNQVADDEGEVEQDVPDDLDLEDGNLESKDSFAY